MRIRISAIETPITHDTRAYAEYRVFRSIAPYEPHIAAVEIGIRHDLLASEPFLCTVAVDLGRCGHVKTQARAVRPSAAIDRAADRLAWLIGRRITGDFTMKAPAFSS